MGLPWQHLPASPITSTLLHNLQLDVPADMQLPRRLLQPDLLRQVIAVDPYAAWVDVRGDEVKDIPPLQPTAQLKPSQLTEASSVGIWLSDYVGWAAAAANETPLLFLEGAGLYLAAVAVGRCLYLHTPWRQTVYPNLYLMTVAVSTYFRKSAGLGLANEVARAAIPHMLMPQPGSPENFMSLLGGVLPTNFDTLPQADRERLTQGNVYAAQRGILRDELSAYLDSTTNNRDMVVIRDSALRIFGVATPAELIFALTVNDWYNNSFPPSLTHLCTLPYANWLTSTPLHATINRQS